MDHKLKVNNHSLIQQLGLINCKVNHLFCDSISPEGWSICSWIWWAPISLSLYSFLSRFLENLPFKTINDVKNIDWGTLNLLANGADEAGRMVGPPQDRHHLTLHKFPAIVAERAVKPLEVQGAHVFAVPHKEATLSHVAATNCTHAKTCSNRDQLNNEPSSFLNNRAVKVSWLVCSDEECHCY